ncbi:MAG: DUF169 domain-containing protein [Bacteroidales bacterium]
MDIKIRDSFTDLWKKYFGDAELPITFYYSDHLDGVEEANKPGGHSCMICDLKKVRNGKSLGFTKSKIGCGGGQKYTGFTNNLRPGFEYFLSCGKPGIEGERYKKDPEIVNLMMENFPEIHKEGKVMVFKRWDQLTEDDDPEVVIFFNTPDILAGLFMLANFDFVGNAGVISPFSSGCGAIILYPYLEKDKEKPRSVIGMFDPSARPCVKPNEFSFATPFKRLVQMIEFMEESFLITPTWKVLRERIGENHP